MNRLASFIYTATGAYAGVLLLHALMVGFPDAVRLSFEHWPTLSTNATRYAVWALAVYLYSKLSTR